MRMTRTAVWAFGLMTTFGSGGYTWDEIRAAQVCSIDELKCLSCCELSDLYKAGSVSGIPTGYFRGVAVVPECRFGSRLRQRVIDGMWRGKCFGGDYLVNQWRGARAIKADVYVGPSWVDGKPAIIMDYRESSIVWGKVRDEMREVCPGVYLGLMFRDKGCQPDFRMHFLLECPCQ